MSAFVKRTKARNGATVIQVVFKQGRTVSKLVHVGTAHCDVEEAELRSLAQDIIYENQLALDLFDDPQGLDMVLEHAYSETLYNALEHVYVLLGFDRIGDETFKKLVLARIIEPTSKFDAIRVLKDLGLKPPSNGEIHRSLRRTIDNDYRAQLSLACFESASMHSLSLLLYDVTTLYFEAQREDEYRKSGLSKERRLDPQITLGLLTGRNGFPLEVQSFEGNRAEVKTIIEVLDSFRDRHGLVGLTVTADAAMLSSGNVAAIKQAGYHFIIASRNAKTPYDVAEYQSSPDYQFRDGEIFETTMDMNTGSGGPRIKQRVIYQYRAKRASIDLINAEKRLEKAKRMVAGTMPLKRNKFVKITGGRVKSTTLWLRKIA
jgi:hypothetical protein